jgi:hypothetical protein
MGNINRHSDILDLTPSAYAATPLHRNGEGTGVRLAFSRSQRTLPMP